MNGQKYNLAIPLSLDLLTEKARKEYLEHLKSLKASRVWIFIDRDNLFLSEDSPKRRKDLSLLDENLRFFEKNGIETGVWFSAFGYGFTTNALITRQGEEASSSWTRIRSVWDNEVPEPGLDAMCPEDPAFRKAFMSIIGDIANLSPDLIMIDDDMCLSVRPGIGCFCPRHMEMISEEFGKKVTIEDIRNYAFVGGKNPYRSAWLSAMRKSLSSFCRELRSVVDKSDKRIRLGFCSGYTSWDIEGTDAVELTYILAGETKPFLRLTGAPYWVSDKKKRFAGQSLNEVIEITRAQESRCRNEDIEIFNEADSWPRPRYNCPASLIECFDIAMRAQGGQGTLKYIFDYYSLPDNEEGYLRLHERNNPLYEHIEKTFYDKASAGVLVCSSLRTIENATLPSKLGDNSEGGEEDVMYRFFSTSASVLTAQSIPVTYDNRAGSSDCAIAFGDDASNIPSENFPKKLILDLPAALIFKKNGVDVGLVSAKAADRPSFESFPRKDGGYDRLLLYKPVSKPQYLGSGIFDCELKAEAEVLSEFIMDGKNIPSAYTYDNGTTKFLVFAADAYTEGSGSTYFCSYQRQRQLLDFIDGDFPHIRKIPGIYTLFKKSSDGKEAAVLFENLSHDALFDFDVDLGKQCRECEVLGVDAKLSEDRKTLHINEEVAPMKSFILNLKY